MARIKYIINERRLAYEGAVQIIAEGRKDEVLARKDDVLEQGPEKEQASIPKPSGAEEPPVIPHQEAAERAAAGLLQPELVRK